MRVAERIENIWVRGTAMRPFSGASDPASTS